MRVLHVISGVSPQYGGPAKAVVEMCRALAQHDCDVEIVTTDADLRNHLTVGDGEVLDVDGVRVRYFRSAYMQKYGFSLSLLRWLEKHLKEYDLLHAHAYFSFPTIVAAHFAAKRRIPYIVRPTGHLDPWCLDQNALRKRCFNWIFQDLILTKASAVHVTSEIERQAVARVRLNARSVVIPLGIEDTSLGPPAPYPDSSVPRLLFLSRVAPKKGLPLLLEAVSQLKNRGLRVELTVAGAGSPSYVQEMRSIVETLEIADQVSFAGFVDGADKRGCFAEADLFVLPSYQENFGLAVLEAMAAGRPVLVSDQVGLAAEIQAANAGRVIPANSIDSLVHTIAEMIRDRAALAAMGTSGYRLVAQRFLWSKVSEQIIRLYRAIQQGSAEEYFMEQHRGLTARTASPAPAP